jgi:peptide/nickel transport system substrate-binding protein
MQEERMSEQDAAHERRGALISDRLGPSTRRQFIGKAMRLGLGAAAAPALAEALIGCARLGGSSQKTLTWSRGDDLRTQDPQQISGLMEGTIARILYDPLMDVDAKGYQVKVLATDYSMAPDGTSYTFKLQPKVKFHDGSDFNADAVVFTFDRLLSNPTFQHASSFKGVLKGVTAVDPLTVRFDLEAPNPGLITSFGEPILGPASAKKYGADFYKYGIGTGPFKYNSWTQNQRWIGDANKDYWVKGMVKLDQIIFRSIPEDATRIAALQSGEVDVIDSLSGDQAAQLAQDPNLSIVRSPGTNELAITFNMRKAPFKNKDARWAVAYAIDKENIVKNIVKAGQPAGASIPPGTIGYDDALFKKVIPYDLSKAKESLAKAQVQPGTKISFKLNPAWFAKIKEACEYVGNQLQQLGFNVDMQFLEPGAYTQARKSGDFDLCIQEIGRAQNPDPNLTILYVDEAFGNFYKEINPNIVKMIESARSELDQQKRDAAYRQIQQVLADDLPELILYQEEFIWGVRKRVTGFEGRTGGDTRVYACDVTS